MGEERQQITRGWRNYRRREPEPKAEFPEIPFPSEGALSVKYIGYLYKHHKIPIWDIVARHPSKLTEPLVHLALYHFISNQKDFDAELRRESEFNRGDALKSLAMTLPSAGLASLVDAEEMFQAALKAEGRPRVVKPPPSGLASFAESEEMYQAALEAKGQPRSERK